MTQLDFSLAQPRQNIDLATPLNMYMKMKQEKRAQNQDKYLQRQQARQEQKQMDVQDLATMTLDPRTGEPDRKAFYTGAMEMGYMDIAENAQQMWMKKDKAEYEVEQLKRKDSQEELQRMGTLAKAALEAYPDNPRMAATRVLETQAKKGVTGALETLEGLQMASDEEIRKNLDFLVKQSEDVDGGINARVRTIYADGKVWLQSPKGNISPALNPETGKQLSQSDSYKTVIGINSKGEQEIFTVSGKKGELSGTGVTPGKAEKEKADVAKTYQDIKTAKTEEKRAVEKWEFEKIKNLQKHKKIKQAYQSQINKFDRFINKATKVANSPDLKYTTGGKRFHPTKGKNIPLISTIGKDLQSDIDNLIGMGTLEVMAELKRLSPTGSTGFGALSAPELKILQDAFTALSNDEVSPNKKKAILIEAIGVVEKYQDGLDAFETKYSDELDKTRNIGKYKVVE